MNSGDYYNAQIECERIAYYSSGNHIYNQALLKKALCLKQLARFSDALLTIERINYIGLNDSMHLIVRYETALCAYLSGAFDIAGNQIIQLRSYFTDSLLPDDAILLSVLVYNEIFDWDNAKSLALLYAGRVLPEGKEKDSLQTVIIKSYTKKELPKLKNPRKARVLSTFLPGLGQAYAGYPLEGITNLSLHLITLGSAGLAFYYGYYLTGYFGGLGLLQRFYFGGLNRVEYLAQKKNYDTIRSFNDEVRFLLTRAGSLTGKNR